MILSIIIPIYKVEKYLRKCLTSCIDDSLFANDYEVIAVNDGSPDDCGLILEEFQLKYPNFQVITQRNQGLSAARNAGLRIAKGEYVWFVDSDDWLEEDAVNIVLDSIKRYPADIIQIGYRNVFEKNNLTTVPKLPYWNDNISGIDYMQYVQIPTPVQFNIYRKSILVNNDIRFTEGILHEDIEFKPRVLHFCNSCKCINKILYNYLQRDSGSITSNLKLKNGIDLITVMCSLFRFFNENVKDPKELEFFYRRISISMNLFIKIYKNLSVNDRISLKSELFRHTEIFNAMRHSNNIKYKTEGLLFGINPRLALKILTKI